MARGEEAETYHEKQARLDAEFALKELDERIGASKHFVSAADLQKKRFAPLKVLVDPIITEGVSIVAGREKIGKSWLMLDIALGVASGATIAGAWKTASHDVLYMALEDGEARLQRRLQRLCPQQEWPQSLTLSTRAPRLDDGLADWIELWAKKAQNPGLVVIDTLQLIRPVRGQSRYADDVSDLATLQAISARHKISILLVHHLRKAIADSDALDAINGSTGLAAGADSVVVMRRHESNRGFEIYTRGRDIIEQQFAMRFDRASCRWQALGQPDEEFRTDERDDLLYVLQQKDDVSPSELALALSIEPDAARKRLARAVRSGHIVKASRGRYALPPSDPSVSLKIEGKSEEE